MDQLRSTTTSFWNIYNYVKVFSIMLALIVVNSLCKN